MRNVASTANKCVDCRKSIRGRVRRGRCGRCYKALLATGNRERILVRDLPLRERFDLHVDRNGPVPEHDPSLGPCWLWTGSIHANGYGLFRVSTDVQIGPHRLAAAWAAGLDFPPPREVHADHRCHDSAVCKRKRRDCWHRRCVNPAHVAFVTAAENNERSASPTALNIPKTHCPKKHEYTPENTRIDKLGRRTCITCQREAYRRWYASRGGKQLSTDQRMKDCPSCGGSKRLVRFRNGVCGACNQAARRASHIGAK